MSLIYNNRNTQTKLANSLSHYLRWYKMECINNTTFAARICLVGRLTYSNLENVTNRIGSFVMKKKASENISFIICVILLSITARSNKNHLEMPQSNKSWISWKSWIEYPLSCSNFYKVYGHFFIIHSYRIGIFCGMFFFSGTTFALIILIMKQSRMFRQLSEALFELISERIEPFFMPVVSCEYCKYRLFLTYVDI